MIYSITTFYLDDSQFQNNQFSYKSIKRDRRWGFFFNKEKALDVIKNNITDIYENNYYNYVCITQEPEGLFPQKKEWWFKVIYKKDQFYKIESLPKKFFKKENQIFVQDKDSFNND